METLTATGADGTTVSVTIDHEHGGRLSSLVIGHHELLVGPDAGADAATGWGCFPMIPYAGRIRRGRFDFDGQAHEVPVTMPPHAIHGTTHLRPWTSTAPGRLRTDLGPDWPWTGHAEQHVDLAADRLDLMIRVVADETMPVSAGWHPWFRRNLVDGEASNDVEITLPAEAMWHRDAEGIPDGTLVEPPPGPWDDCFTALIGPVELHWPGALRLWIESDCEHVVVYDEQAGAVCVEPQSAPPDAHNSGEDLAEVEAGDGWVIHATLAWELL